MSINDMRDAGIELQGDIIVARWDDGKDDYAVRKPLNSLSRKERKELLDLEIGYIFPMREYIDNIMTEVIVIEVKPIERY